MPEAIEYEKLPLEELMGLVEQKSINLGPATGTEVPEQIAQEVPEQEEEDVIAGRSAADDRLRAARSALENERTAQEIV